MIERGEEIDGVLAMAAQFAFVNLFFLRDRPQIWRQTAVAARVVSVDRASVGAGIQAWGCLEARLGEVCDAAPDNGYAGLSAGVRRGRAYALEWHGRMPHARSTVRNRARR